MNYLNNAVVIIIYSPKPTDVELLSFSQCLKILNKHMIFIVRPQSLSTDIYDKIINEFNINIKYEIFDDSYFKSIMTYNQLVKTPVFYERFLKYDFILTYQLDAWVFKDDLNEWCSKNYDYIGAPWYTDKGQIRKSAGNGGFSLRKISTFQNLFTGKFEKYFFSKLYFFLRELKISFSLKDLDIFFNIIKSHFSLKKYIINSNEFEDGLFYRSFSSISKTKVANSSVASFFSFERFPEDLYIRTNYTLPFGCHAYLKHNPEFWIQYIPFKS